MWAWSSTRSASWPPAAGGGERCERSCSPLLGLVQDESRYFDWHHTAADTFDKIEPGALAESAAFLAALTYVLAEQDATLPRVR